MEKPVEHVPSELNIRTLPVHIQFQIELPSTEVIAHEPTTFELSKGKYESLSSLLQLVRIKSKANNFYTKNKFF